MHRTLKLAAAIAVATTFAGCASLPPGMQGYLPNSANTYAPSGTQNAQTVRLGTVIAVRQVTINAASTEKMLASGVGAAVGGLLGHQVGGGNGKTLATVAGALGGAVGGNLAGNRLYRQPGLQVTVKLDAGNGSSQILSVTQAADVALRAGERVQVIGNQYGGQPIRVEPLQ